MQIEDIKKLNLDPGDIVVVRVEEVLSGIQRDAIHEYLTGVLGEGVKALILDGGVSIDVLSTKKTIDERNIASEAADQELSDKIRIIKKRSACDVRPSSPPTPVPKSEGPVIEVIGLLTESISAQTEAMERLAHSNYTLAEAMLAEQDDQGEHTGALDLAGNPV